LRERLAFTSVQKSSLRLSYPGKLELWTARLLQDHVVAGNLQLINRHCERRLNFDPVLVTEFVSAMHVSHKHNAIAGEFPNGRIQTSRHAPFANDAAMSATGYDA
jgi:hypothetical protein